VERERGKDFETLARKYRAVGPLLTKMEGLVVHTNTGKSPKLNQYYSYWERRVFNSLTKVGSKARVLEQTDLRGGHILSVNSN
jgi:dynein heavy chain